MRWRAALLVLAAGCNRTPAPTCATDGDCAQGSACVAKACVVGDTAPRELEFVVLPPTGSNLAPAAMGDPCFSGTRVRPGCLRQLLSCSWPKMSLKGISGNRLFGRGTLLPGLDLVQDVDERFGGRTSLDLQLLPGDWSFVFVPSSGTPHTLHPPPVSPCQEDVPVDLNGQDTNSRLVTVQVVIDAVYDPHPFCDVVLDVVADVTTQRVISNEQALPVGDPPFCLADDPSTFTAVLQADASAKQAWVRIRPRDPGHAAAPVQFVPLPGLDADPNPKLVVSARARLQTVEIAVRDDEKNPVAGASIRLEGTLDSAKLQEGCEDGWCPRFVTGAVVPDAKRDGYYTANVPPGCYTMRVTPPDGTLQSVGTSAIVEGFSAKVCTDPAFHVGAGKVVQTSVSLAKRNLLTVTVRSADRTLVFGAILTALPLGDGRMVRAETGANGVAQLQLDANQDYDLEVAPTSGDLPRVRVQLKDHPAVLDVDLPRSVRVVGQVVRGTEGDGPVGQPVGQAVVQAFDPRITRGARPLGEGVTDADGRFSILVAVPAGH